MSLAVERGSVTGIIGANGAGKSTLLKTIFGFLHPRRGRIVLDGHEIQMLPPHAVKRRGVSYVAQGASVFPQLTVAENLWVTRYATNQVLHPFRSASRDPETRERVELTLEQIGLPALAHRPAGTLSYGDVALLEIGMALISNPQLLLLDEPTCGMSPAETERAVEKIKQLARTIDIVIIEHDMSVVFEIAQDITVMTQGEILASGSPDEISSDERVREAYLGRPEDEDYVEEAINA